MGKSEVAQQMNGMSTAQYMFAMGGSVQSDRDTGISQSVNTVYRYYNILRNYALNRYSWQSDTLDPHDLQLIEWFIFHKGKCAFVRPTFYSHANSEKGVKLMTPICFDVTYTLQNNRTSEVLKLNVVNQFSNALMMPLKTEYSYPDFSILSDAYSLFPINNVPMTNTAWEYANKLYELDLTFNANATKQRIPLLFNNGVSEKRLENGQSYNMGNFTAADIVREAQERNEQFVEIPQSQVGEKGLLHSTNQYQENNLMDYTLVQRKLYDEYMELIGISAQQEQTGVYQAQSVQEKNMGNNSYKALINLRNRRFWAEQFMRKFPGHNLRVEQLEYM